MYKNEIGGNTKSVSGHNNSRVSYGQNTQKLKVADPCNIALGLVKPLLILLWYMVMITRQFNHCKLCPSLEKGNGDHTVQTLNTRYCPKMVLIQPSSHIQNQPDRYYSVTCQLYRHVKLRANKHQIISVRN